MKRIVHCAAALFAGLSFTPAVLACGDRLAALGGGVRFERVFYSRHPGSVVVYAPAATALRTATDQFGMVDALKRAGHSVRAIGDAAELRLALAAAPPDVVLVDVGTAPDDGVAPGTATVLPVAFREGRRAGAAPASADGCYVQVEGRSVRQLLRTLESVLERRRRGDALACDAARTRAAN